MAKLSALRNDMNAEEREMYETAKKGGGGFEEGVGSLESEDRTGLTGRKVFPKNVPGNNKQETSGKVEPEKKKDENDLGKALLSGIMCHSKFMGGVSE